MSPTPDSSTTAQSPPHAPNEKEIKVLDDHHGYFPIQSFLHSPSISCSSVYSGRLPRTPAGWRWADGDEGLRIKAFGLLMDFKFTDMHVYHA